MASIIIPTQSIPFYNIRTTLDGDDYNIHFRFNNREKRWYFDMYSKEDNPLLLGNKIICLFPLLAYQTEARDLPPGFFYCVSATNDNSPPGLNELGPNRRCSLLYYPQDITTATF